MLGLLADPILPVFAILFVGFGQVFVLKSFFAEKKPSQLYAGYN